MTVDQASELQRIGELIRTQDNRATDAPIFIVQEKKRDYGYDTDYCDDYVWLDSTCDWAESTPAASDQLDAQEQIGEVPGNWQKTGYKDRWEFVTACFTEQGCRDFIAEDGHNHGELRIYAAGSYRNREFRAVRDFLMGASDG